MRPQRRSFMPGASARVSTIELVTFSSTSASQSSSRIASAGCGIFQPALLIRISTLPRRAVASRARRSASGRWPTSATSASTRAPVSAEGRAADSGLWFRCGCRWPPRRRLGPGSEPFLCPGPGCRRSPAPSARQIERGVFVERHIHCSGGASRHSGSGPATGAADVPVRSNGIRLLFRP